jgi:hypothetical protein
LRFNASGGVWQRLSQRPLLPYRCARGLHGGYLRGVNLRGPVAHSTNAVGKIGTEERSRLLLIDARKERHGTVEVADPDLGGAGVEVERAFFVDLGGGIRWGKNLDADLWRASEYEGSLDQLGPATVEPHEVNGFDTVSGGKRAFGESTTVGEEGVQQVCDLALAVGLGESWSGLMMM